jgi:hypothetical protein
MELVSVMTGEFQLVIRRPVEGTGGLSLVPGGGE